MPGGEKGWGGSLEQKMGGELFFPLSNVRMSQQVGLKDWFPLKLSCISSVFRSGPGFFLGENVFFLGIR